jgi:hypothetical protein
MGRSRLMSLWILIPAIWILTGLLAAVLAYQWAQREE